MPVVKDSAQRSSRHAAPSRRGHAAAEADPPAKRQKSAAATTPARAGKAAQPPPADARVRTTRSGVAGRGGHGSDDMDEDASADDSVHDVLHHAHAVALLGKGPASAEVAGVSMTHLTHKLYPADGVTKCELAAYYLTVAPHLLPYARARACVLRRFPRGFDPNPHTSGATDVAHRAS